MSRENNLSPRRPPSGAPHAIENHQKSVRVAVRPLRHFLHTVLTELGLAEDCVAIRLINDREMTRLNHQYRNKPRTTDVLSFPAEQRRRPSNLQTRVRKLRGSFLGDIAISPVVARRNARVYGRHLDHEFRILILHGVLHLLGYDHENDRGQMNRVETTLRGRLGIAG
jgi:probable rRNA maturation factor